ncbi:Ubiquitin-like protein [Glarea lozoyensis ATCC 20868]|uniref:UBX domain-containing protein 2 n=1 Tax=Glarea lozoyensis (strain ATCC 20868 / MF5171) TaxID=1116229 RepID=S3CCQ8_GLAL2|nr:Ubiquitin-like protein [Glarea lozoyensis ATCC 20868]EPE24307.1 Ubiquitin-like protein [Glarea lozoyensis ATCC 20868]
MFFNGDLQSGIAQAMAQSKMVACFVTDEEQESSLWEEVFLKDSIVKSLLSSQTVLLRLIAGSQEALYLAAIFPIPKTPTLVIIKNGELKEYLASGTSKEDFLRRVGVAFQSSVPETPSRIAAALRGPLPGAVDSIPAAAPVVDQPSTSAFTTQPSSQPQAKPKSSGERKEQKPASSGKGKSKELPITSKLAPESSANKVADTKYALQRKKEQKDARAERDRILARVEADKTARKREAELRAQARVREAVSSQAAGKSSSGPIAQKQLHAECAVQVRLFDGSSIRERFPSGSSLRAHVRPWVDSKQELDFPYNFKLILTPLPNRDISLSEEEQDLQSLGLTPSATLILVPIKEFTSAYEGGPMGLVYRGASAGYGLLAGSLSWVAGTVGGVLGSTPSNEPPEATAETLASATIPRPGRVNIRTLRDQQPREDQQFYNGNALNFEPNDNEENHSN